MRKGCIDWQPPADALAGLCRASECGGGGRMVLKAGIGALAVSAAITAAAMADCRTIRFKFSPDQNDSITTTGVSTRGSACTHRYQSGSFLQMTSGAIVSRPGNGTLSEIGSLQFRYENSDNRT